MGDFDANQVDTDGVREALNEVLNAQLARDGLREGLRPMSPTASIDEVISQYNELVRTLVAEVAEPLPTQLPPDSGLADGLGQIEGELGRTRVGNVGVAGDMTMIHGPQGMSFVHLPTPEAPTAFVNNIKWAACSGGEGGVGLSYDATDSTFRGIILGNPRMEATGDTVGQSVNVYVSPGYSDGDSVPQLVSGDTPVPVIFTSGDWYCLEIPHQPGALILRASADDDVFGPVAELEVDVTYGGTIALSANLYVQASGVRPYFSANSTVFLGFNDVGDWEIVKCPMEPYFSD